MTSHARIVGLTCLLTLFTGISGCEAESTSSIEAEPTTQEEALELETPDGAADDQPLQSESSSEDLNRVEPSLMISPVAFQFDLEGGSIVGHLSDQQTFDSELPAATVPEGTREVWLHARSTRQKGTRLTVTLYGEDVAGLDPKESQFQNYKLFIKGEAWSPKIRLPEQGLAIGSYRLHLAIEDGPAQDLMFAVTSEFEPAISIADQLPPAGFNVAGRALGGSLHSFSGQKNTRNWRAENLIDGFAQIHARRGESLSSGWLVQMTPEEPPEVVLAFHERRIAELQAVVFDPIRGGLEDSGIPRHIEILATTREDGSGFERIRTIRLNNDYGWQWTGFDPVAARYLKIRILNNYPGRQVALGEIMVIESDQSSNSILADAEIDLAAPGLGGGLVSLSSQHPKFQVAQTFNLSYADKDADNSEWRSSDTMRRSADYLPQDFVYTFSGDKVALIDRVELSLPPGVTAKQDGEQAADEHWTKSVAVSISSSERATDLEEVARVEVMQNQTASIPVNREARYLRIRLLENYGGPYSHLGGLKIVEGSRMGYESVGHDQVRRLAAGRELYSRTLVQIEPDQYEPNNSPAEATPVLPGQELTGNLHAPADVDYMSFSTSGTAEQTMTLDLKGTPSIRTSVQLQDADGQVLKEYLPRGDQGERARFTWRVASGDYLLGVSEPPLSLVVVWDTSGSMDGRMAALEKAVRQFLDGIEPGEQVQLIRFSDKEEVLLEAFSSDRDTIMAALDGKFAPNGSTALIDALSAAQTLLSDVQGRSAIVAFTDGLDTASRTDEGSYWTTLRDSTAQIFTVGLGSDLGNFSYRTGSTGHQFLNGLSTLSGGRYFHARSEANLDDIFQTIAADLRARPEYSIVTEMSDRTGALRVVSVGERIPGLSPPRFELILDASGSMKRKVADGRTRMEVAQTVLKEIVRDIPDDVEVALRVFGHRIREGQPGDCADTELLQPLERLDKASLFNSIDNVEALGTTLLAHTLEQLPEDLGAQDRDQFVVLVTDGEEECRSDLPQTVQRLKDEGLKMNLSIIGFSIDDEAIRGQLEEIASIGGGIFAQAQAGEELKAALDQALAAAFEVRDADGEVVGRGNVNGERLTLPAGVYNVVVDAASGELAPYEITIDPGSDRILELDRQGRQIGVTAR